MGPPARPAMTARRRPEIHAMLLSVMLRLRRWLRYRPERRYMRGMR